MITQPHPAPESTRPASEPTSPAAKAVRPPEQKAQAKALKKERKHERLRFFYGWCQSCKAFGSSF
jgi:hypothetical protein